MEARARAGAGAGRASRAGAWLLGAVLLGGCAGGTGALDCLAGDEECPRGYTCDSLTRRCAPAVPEDACATIDDCQEEDKPLCSGGRCTACDSLGTPERADLACRASERPGWAACVRGGPRKGQCSECRTSAQCSDAARPVCDATTATCRPCQRHGECPASSLCRTRTGSGPSAPSVVEFPDVQIGQCVPADRVTFVDTQSCPQSGADGTAARPFCDIQAAVDRSATGYVVVRPRGAGTGAYARVTFPAGRRTVVVGPGRESMLGTPILGAVASGTGTVAVLSDVALSGDPAGLSCRAGAEVTLVRSQIAQATTGVDATGCARISIDATAITGCRGTGLRIGPGTRAYRVVNSLLLGNGQSASAPPGSSAVSIAAGATGTFALNTLINNGSVGQDGGAVNCEESVPPVLAALTDSLILQNSKSARTDAMGNPVGTQFKGACRLARVVVGIDTVSPAAPNEQVARGIPDLDQALRLLDTPNNRALCIDRGHAVDGVALDYFGSERPRGQGLDLGAHELR